MENKLKDIFQKKLNNYQAPVDASAWNAIQSGIGSGGATVTSGGFLASLGAKITAAIVAASVVGATIYYITLPNEIEKTSVELTQKEVVDNSSEAIVITPQKNKEVTKPAEPTPAVKEKTVAKKKIASPLTKVGIQQDMPVPIVNQTEKTTNKTSNKTSNVPNNSTTETNPSMETTPPATPSLNELIEAGVKVDFEIQTLDLNELSYQLVPSKGVEDDVEVLWNFGNGKTSKETQPTITFEEEGNYTITLSLINVNKTYEVASHEVKAYYPVSWEVQNIFTPNDDLYNQYFDPSAKAENLTIESLVVYDHAQQVMFTSTPTTKKWDGKTPNGQLAPQGYYFYQVSALGHNGQMHTKKGKVYLITGN